MLNETKMKLPMTRNAENTTFLSLRTKLCRETGPFSSIRLKSPFPTKFL